MQSNSSIKEAIHKIEHFCAYQDRCHVEVEQKLKDMKMTSEEIDNIITHLIKEDFLNEERFARSFARGKHRIKKWGKIRIANELKVRGLNQTLVNIAFKEIATDEYLSNLNELSIKQWHTIQEKNHLKKRKKFCDYLLRRGYESNLVYEKLKEMESLD